MLESIRKRLLFSRFFLMTVKSSKCLYDVFSGCQLLCISIAFCTRIETITFSSSFYLMRTQLIVTDLY